MNETRTNPVPPKDGPRMVLIDGQNLAYRSFYAMMQNPPTTSEGVNVSVPWGVHRIVNRLLRELAPDYVAFVLEGGSSGRSELFSDYKANRKDMPEELRASFPVMERVVEAMGVSVVRLDGYEADDVIGTLAVKAASAGINVVIVAADKDFVQLVSERIALYHPGKNGRGGQQPEWTDHTNATERFGVPVERVVDYMALVGDSADNVPGARGIGPKLAVELVRKFGTVEELLDRIVNVEQKRARKALTESRDAVLLSKKLVTIQTDVPLPKLGNALRMRGPDRAALSAVLAEIAYEEERRPQYA